MKIQTKVNFLPKSTFEILITIPDAEVKNVRDKLYKAALGQLTVKGFRKGKAPTKIAEKHLDQKKLSEEIVSAILPEAYTQAVKENGLQPIVAPKIELLAIEENKDWQIKATSCLAPQVKLGDWEKAIKGSAAKDKIWLPGKDKKDDRNNQKSPDVRLSEITKVLLETVDVEIPDILTADEVNRMLSRLVDQTASIGLTVQEYLKSRGKTGDQLRNDYAKTAEQTLKMEFILSEIAKQKDFKVADSQVDDFIKAAPDKNIQKQLASREQKVYIQHLLLKRRVVDYLLSL